MKPANAIEVRDMTKSFKVQYDHAKTLKDMLVHRNRGKVTRNVVLKNINLDIQKGETVALIGTNGSGKSTLLKLMTKIIFPNKGTIETKGKLTSLLELGAGFHPDFTGRENIYFNAAIFGMSEAEINGRIDQIIAFSELGKFIDEPIRTYSSGMYMRLAFSIAINVDAEILLIDEILAVGDQHFQDKCFAKLKELKNTDKTIVIVSHSLETVKELCTRAIWIYKGEFRLDGDPVYVIDEYLKQIAIDNKEEKKKAVESGTYQYKGIIFFDTPKDYARVPEDKDLGIAGWSISDCENARFELRIGNRIVENIIRGSRPDVVEAYSEQYGGFMDVDTVGWSVHLCPKDYADQFNSSGEMIVTAYLYQEDGTVIQEKYISIKVEKEQTA